jgi:hypothetical protein
MVDRSHSILVQVWDKTRKFFTRLPRHPHCFFSRTSCTLRTAFTSSFTFAPVTDKVLRMIFELLQRRSSSMEDGKMWLLEIMFEITCATHIHTHTYPYQIYIVDTHYASTLPLRTQTSPQPFISGVLIFAGQD